MATYVKQNEDETIDSLIRRWKRGTEADGLLNELRNREFYIPPSEKRRLKSEAARKRIAIEEKKRRKYYVD